MRQDLNKLLCERERPRSSDDYSNYRNIERFNELYEVPYDDEEIDELFSGESSAHREPMKLRFGWNSKPFNENLNPLWGFVRKNAGRKWDNVYSELCENFDKRSVINQHILEHLFQFVAIKSLFVEDGKVFDRRRYGDTIAIEDSHYEYYVDPRDGILKRTNSKTYKQINRERAAAHEKEKAAVFRKIDDLTELHKLEDTWFEIKFTKYNGTKVEKNRTVWNDPSRVLYTYFVTEYSYHFDVLEKKSVNKPRVATSKRTLSHKELKKHGLI